MKHLLAHLHPVLVHLPIGILLLALFLHLLSRIKPQSLPDSAAFIRWTLGIGAVSALLAALCGWLLSGEGGYESDALTWHARLGWATTAMAAITWWLYPTHWGRLGLYTSGILLTVAGHLGGNLTHGEGYLFAYKSIETVTRPAVTPEMPAFDGLIQPILKEKCQSCHNDQKAKGELNMSSVAALQNGGKHGNPLIGEKGAAPLLLSRCQLPASDDAHMPPAGKPQPTAEELRLLEIWLNKGASFTTTVAALDLPDDLMQYATQGGKAPESPVFAQNIDAVDQSDLDKLHQLRVHVSKRAAGQPWLGISLAGYRQLSQPLIEALGHVREQTYDLDLANTDIDDATLEKLGDWPNLTKLNLANTKVGRQVSNLLKKSPWLESLNLTGTAVTDADLATVGDLKHLRHLYTWRTAVSEDFLNQLHGKQPQLNIYRGASVSDTIPLVLRPPKLQFQTTFFDDTAHVLTSYAFKGVMLHYTTDVAASPTSQSPVWTPDTPMVIRNTTHLRVRAEKAGWTPSAVAEAIFVRKRFHPDSARLSTPMSPKSPSKSGKALTDSKVGNTRSDLTWVTYEGEHMTATIDLKQKSPVSKVYVHCYEQNESWIFAPAGVKVLVSDDGKRFRQVVAKRYPVNTAMALEKVHLLTIDLPADLQARYVQVKVESLLKNPDWHPGKGQKCWIFVDEISME